MKVWSNRIEREAKYWLIYEPTCVVCMWSLHNLCSPCDYHQSLFHRVVFKKCMQSFLYPYNSQHEIIRRLSHPKLKSSAHITETQWQADAASCELLVLMTLFNGFSLYFPRPSQKWIFFINGNQRHSVS